MNDQKSKIEELSDHLDDLGEDNEIPSTNDKVTSNVDPIQSNNKLLDAFYFWGLMVVIWSAYYVMNGHFPFRKPPEREERFRPIDVSPQNLLTDTQVLNGQATENYWKVAVADLHRTRFPSLFTEDLNEQASIYFDRTFVDMKFRLQDAQYATNPPAVAFVAGIDGDLMEMSKRHLDIDEKYMKILEEIQEINKKLGVSEDTESLGFRTMQGEALYLRVMDDPSFLDQISDEKVRSVIQRLVEQEGLDFDQYREIEIMQARMQERYKENKFPLPVDEL